MNVASTIRQTAKFHKSELSHKSRVFQLFIIMDFNEYECAIDIVMQINLIEMNSAIIYHLA